MYASALRWAVGGRKTLLLVFETDTLMHAFDKASELRKLRER